MMFNENTVMNKNKDVTICVCTSRPFIDREKVAEVARSLAVAGYTIRYEADLCEKAISSAAEMQEIAASTVMACYPRAVLALFDRLALVPAGVIDLRNSNSEDVLKNFHLLVSSVSGEFDRNGLDTLPARPGQDAWYPAIDRDRCCNCGRCHDFCLFGVYEIEEKKVKVCHPRNCKIDCPACARICPQKAIIFPKYPQSPINGGLANEEAVGIDTKALYNEALRYRLSQRRAGVSLLKNKPGNTNRS
jgi:NAD-dependent dihydropyrimidine dehydrogenase PreA subunit